jgi:hypothetical protein
MTSRASGITSALTHRQGFHGQGHAVSDHAMQEPENARVVPDAPIRARGFARCRRLSRLTARAPRPHAAACARPGGTVTDHRQVRRGPSDRTALFISDQ